MVSSGTLTRELDRTGRSVVLKPGRESEHRSVESVRAEAGLLDLVRHPGVVEVLRVEQYIDNGTTFGSLVLAPVDGPTLDQVELSPSEIAGVLAAVSSTLSVLHQRRVTHGAIRADHVLLDRGRTPRLCGFGAAKRVDADDISSRADDVRQVALLARALCDRWRRDRATDPQTGPAPLERLRTVRASTRSTRRSRRGWRADRGDSTGEGDEAAVLRRLDETTSIVLSTNARRRMSAAELAKALSSIKGVRLPNPSTASPSPAASSAPTPTPTPAPTRTLAPARSAVPPPTPAPPPERRPPPSSTTTRRRLAAAAAALSIAAIGIGAVALTRTKHGSPVAQPPASAGCPALPDGLPRASLDRNQCPLPVRVNGSVVHVGSARFSLGDPGDPVVVGDWDCDGEATPAVLQVRTGRLYRFDRWPSLGTPASGVLMTTAPEATGIETLRNGRCDRLRVTHRHGPAQTIDPLPLSPRPPPEHP